MNNKWNLTLKESKNFDVIFEDMQKQFPPEELKDIDSFKNLLTKTDYKLFILEDNSQLIGYIIFLENKQTNTIWIDYIAILQNFHSMGYGSEIFHIIKNTLKSIKGCYLEVEKPNSTDINTLRRIKFYTNLGAKKLNINYIYPNKFGGFPMDLYFMPFNKTYFPSKEEILNVIKHSFSTIHSDIENIKEIFSKIK